MGKLKTNENIISSFRDPSGFVFYQDSSVYRMVSINYKENYDYLMNSGLYKALVDAGLLIPHEEINVEGRKGDGAYKIIKPEPVPFISYPYEWSFSQLKNAALVTLEIQKKSLDFDMSLKDCSAYNVQFVKGKPVLIDTLSFERRREGKPWVAYRQFCQHFLAPLALMCHRDIRLNRLLQLYIDGIPLDLASALLPFHARLKFSLFSHIYLHAKSQQYFAGKSVKKNRYKMGRLASLSIIDSLEAVIKKLGWSAKGTEWADYYGDNNYSQNAFNHKKHLVSEFLYRVNPKDVWDLGANAGAFSRVASDRGIQTVSFDIDPAAVERNHLECVRKGETNILPLLLDVTNPSPGIGWESEERKSLLKRGPVDTVFALALIHHLAISNNLPFGKIADFFSRICKSLIIEFVPKDDLQLQRLLSSREDIFSDYTQHAFEREFKKYFTIKDFASIKDSKRTLYLMQNKNV